MLIKEMIDKLPTKDGWLEGRGKAPLPADLDWLSIVFNRYYPEYLSLPFLYPTESGGVRVEWSLGLYEISLDISLVSRVSEWHVLNMETNTEEYRILDLAEEGDWEWLVEKIQDYQK